MTEPDPRPRRTAAHRRDLLVMLAVVVGTSPLAGRVDTFETFFEWSRRYEDWHVDEVVVALSMAGGLFATYSCRSHRALEAEAERLRATQRPRDRGPALPVAVLLQPPRRLLPRPGGALPGGEPGGRATERLQPVGADSDAHPRRGRPR